MKKKIAVSFDTSNYTTSCAFFDGRSGENMGRLLDVPDGALGLRQSDALFSHIKRLPEIFKSLSIGGEIIAVGASTAPRETEGSYMPCFLAGASHGMVLAEGLGVPFFGFSHQQGHIAAAAWSAGRIDLLSQKHLCWHLSGGTTELLLVNPCGTSVTCEIIGGTSDISAGQLIDRAGNLLGLKFPSGAELDGLAVAAGGEGTYAPRVTESMFSLSGVEHKMKAMVQLGKPPAQTARFVFHAITEAVIAATEHARKTYGALPVLFSGGVSCSVFLRGKIPQGIYCEPKYSADNAMGAAILTFRAVTNG